MAEDGVDPEVREVTKHLLERGSFPSWSRNRVWAQSRQVENAAKQFRYQSKFLDALQIEHPCVRIKTKRRDQGEVITEIPFDLSGVMPVTGTILPDNLRASVVNRLNQHVKQAIDSELGVISWRYDLAVIMFEGALYKYIKLLKRYFSKPKLFSAKSTLTIKVITKHYGYKVLYSPALLFRNNVSLSGDLSSPVVGELEPGIYIFGVTDGHRSIWENVEETVPPTTIKTVRA